jgi:diguanylate cyclase (GGDEF)-like protein/PAS domain S-box-containing protein
MIIEDSRLYQQKIKDIISDIGYNVSAVFAYGEKAVDYIIKENNTPDLIIIDIVLKGKMDGYKVAEIINSKKNIPFIFLTGNADKIKDFKASSYLNKPFNDRELKNNIEIALYKHKIYNEILKSNEEKEMILNTTDTQIWYLKDLETYGKANQAHADFIGYDRGYIENKKIDELFEEKEAKKYKLDNEKVFHSKKKKMIEKWSKNSNGEKRLLKIIKNPKLNKNGKVEYIVCFAEDITKNKRTEKIIKDLHQTALDFKELKTQEQILQMTLKVAQDLLDFNLCNILFVKEKEFISVVSSNEVEHENRSTTDKSIAAKTYNKGKGFIIDDLQNDPEALSVKNIYKSAISIPIGKYGVFQVAAPDKNFFSKEDLELAEILISYTIAALDRVYAQYKITEQKEYLSTILKSIPEIIILLDEKGNYLNIWTSNSDDLVDEKENLIGKNVKEILPKRIADKFLRYCKLAHQDKNQKSFDYQLNINGETKYFDVIFSPITSKEKMGEIIISTIRNITELKVNENKLKEQKAYFEQLFNNSTEAIALLDTNHQVLKLNKKFESLFGFKESELLNKNLDDFIIPDELVKKGKEYTEKVKTGEKIESESIRKTKSGERINVYLQGFPIELVDGQIGIYGLYKDITERKEKEKRIKYLSFHDEMTGLYNRRYFENELKRLELSRKYPITIIIGDLDGLKKINDNYGHKAGDRFIINAANIMKLAVRAEDIVARIGGDEFAIVLPSTNHKEARLLCQRIQKNIEKLNNTKKLISPLSISLGFEVMENSSHDLIDVFNRADQKMYINKGRK